MTYYRIMQYCIKNGMSPAQADYMRKLVRRLVQQKEAEAADRMPKLSTAEIRECHRQLKAVECSPAEAIQYSDFRGLTEMLKEDLQIECLGCAEGQKPSPSGHHYWLDGTIRRCTRQENNK